MLILRYSKSYYMENFQWSLYFFSTLFQIIRYFDFSRYIVFAIHLNIHYVDT
jgi:hypothetical protein